MKKETPKEIYIFEDKLQREDHVVKYGVNQDKGIEGLIVYTRIDVFIDKAVDWLEKKGCCYRWDDSGSPNWDMIEAFIKYMEGE